jgi:hypothetical protein
VIASGCAVAGRARTGWHSVPSAVNSRRRPGRSTLGSTLRTTGAASAGGMAGRNLGPARVSGMSMRCRVSLLVGDRCDASAA